MIRALRAVGDPRQDGIQDIADMKNFGLLEIQHFFSWDDRDGVWPFRSHEEIKSAMSESRYLASAG